MIKFFKKNWLIILILGLATFLRLFRITTNPVSLFGDELDVGYHAYSILKTGKDYQGNFMPLNFHSLAEWRTPLYLYSAVPTVALYGVSPLGVRLPAVLFGVFGIYGFYLLVAMLSKLGGFKEVSIGKLKLEHFAALFISLSPWHLQYSRAAFEVTMLLAFLIFGLYFFLRSIEEKGRYLWLSVALLVLTPSIYSTAKLFTPFLLVFIFLNWRKEIVSLAKKNLMVAVVVGLSLGLPVSYATLFGGGAQRAAYTSVFTDPTVISEVGSDRTRDFLMRGELVLGAKPTVLDRTFHNKFVRWFETISSNYLQSFSFDFLFSRGDPNPRHSPVGVGEFFKVEIIAFLLGLIFYFSSSTDKKIKRLLLFWLVIGALPAALTRDGGNHATRLILILPPLVFLIAYGFSTGYSKLTGNWQKVVVVLYGLLYLISFSYYFHLYHVHYPWDSERWWHAGFKDAIQSVKVIDSDYDKVIISMAGEPVWIFFSAWYQYPPNLWQESFPIGNDVELTGFGKISHIDKFYFGKFSVDGGSIYDLGKYIDSKTLYLAVAKEVPPNLIMEPERAPQDLRLLKSIAYPDGEPAFYLFAGTR